MVNTLKTWWARLSRLPLGRFIFSKIVGFFIPYTGSISPHVVKLVPGNAEVRIRDCRKHRNHLRSIHALALANLGEFTTGLAVHFAMDDEMRAILTRLDIQFLKKARGPITARAKTSAPYLDTEGPLVVDAHLFDEQGVLVTKVSATWLLGKNEQRKVSKS